MKISAIAVALVLLASVCGQSLAEASRSNMRASGIEEVVVQGYRRETGVSVVKSGTPISEVPASIQIVPLDVLRDQAAVRLDDVFDNVSGIVKSGNTLNAQSEVRPVIRGFESQVLFRNGMRATNVGAVDLVNVESVEVLKGPASILFGAIEPGGVLNYNTKRPQREASYEISQQFGRYDHSRTTLDATGPLNLSGTALYRLNAGYTNAESFRDEVDRENFTVAPSLLFNPTERTELLVDLSFAREEAPFDSGIPFGADDEPLVPDDTFFGDPDLDGQELDDYFASYRLEHAFNDAVTLRNQFQFHRVDAQNETIRNRGVAGPPGAEVLARRFQNLDSVDDEYQFLTELVLSLETGGVRHDALVGVDLVYQDQDSDRFRQNLDPIAINENPQTVFTPPAMQPMQNQELQNEWAAIYVQDQLTLFDERLHILVGGRFDAFESEFENAGVQQPKVDETEFTGRLGVLYDLTPWLAPFVSVSESFQPQGAFAVDADDQLLSPEEGLQYELGAKLELLDQRLLATLAAFHIEKENVSVFDLPNFLETGAIAFTTSDQESRGVELDVTGEVTDALQVIANYAYTDTELTENRADPSLEGDDLGNVPEHSLRLWGAYEVPAGRRWSGLGIGAGLRYESERRAQFDDTELDAFTTFDAGIWYRRAFAEGRSLRAQLNFENLTDEDFYPRASDSSIVHPGEPLDVRGTLTLVF